MGVSDFGGAWKETLIIPGIQEVIHHTDHHVCLDLFKKSCFIEALKSVHTFDICTDNSSAT